MAKARSKVLHFGANVDVPIRATFPVVGVGASAGGLKALLELFAGVGQEKGMAFVVVMHLDPTQESHLANLLQSSTSMTVRQVTAPTKVEPGHAYIVPPEKDLAMIDGHVVLTPRAEPSAHRAPIDLLFRTLAETHGDDAMAIVLSGMGTDGTLGVRSIREHGGIAMAQAPEDAEFDSMPRSAIATGLVDCVLPARELGTELVRLHRQRTSQTPRFPEGEGLAEDEPALFRRILVHVRDTTGHDFTGYKPATILRRLDRRMQIVGAATLGEYAARLHDSAEETHALFNDFLVVVTSFFRDADALTALASEVIPSLFAEKASDETVRVWVAGCATGEEAYTLAMMLIECADTLDAPPAIQIFATDVNERAFGFAREGLYPESIANEVSAERLTRFFTKEPGGYRIKKSVREKVLFATHNLLKDPPFLRVGLVSCRNLLIYLQKETQQQVIEIFHYALTRRGYLFLGTSESIDAGGRLFRVVDKLQRLYQSSGLSRPVAVYNAAVTVPPSARTAGMVRTAPTPRLVMSALHQRLLEEYAPPSLVVDDNEDVVHLSNNVGRFLSVPGGVPSTKLFDMLDGDLRLELRTLLRSALRSGEVKSAQGLEATVAGRPSHIDVTVRPLRSAPVPNAVEQNFALIIFEEEEARKSSRSSDRTARVPDGLHASDVREAERMLEDAREQLRARSEEHEATIEELRAMNEELQSATEEQNAISEELETSREELQSINEELRAVNQEHRVRNDELAEVNSDLMNLIDSTDVGTLFLDEELRVRRFTPAIAGLFNLIATDLGRPFSDITHRLDYVDLDADIRTVLRTLVRIEREIPSSDDRWFSVRISPYRSVENRIVGAVLTFVDTTAHKNAEIEREALHQQVRDRSLTKSNFISVMSHEFRTPLNAIIGYAGILEAGAVGAISEQQRSHLERISLNGAHLSLMVDEILDTARLEEETPTPTWRDADLGVLVRDVAEGMMSLVTAKKLPFDVRVSTDAIPIVTDEMMFRRIFFNLLGNAVRFTDKGRISIDARADHDWIFVDVRDSGIGIAAENLERVFDRFWQVDQSKTRLRGGTGLGLMVCRTLTECLSGTIDVESEVGRGSTFRVKLPRDGRVARALS